MRPKLESRFGEDEEIRTLWIDNCFETNTIMHLTQTGAFDRPTDVPSFRQDCIPKRVAKMKPNELIDMQEALVLEMRQLVDKFSVEFKRGKMRLKDQMVVPWLQGMASFAIEKKYSVSTEEMATAGFLKSQQLGENPRFMKATMDQKQELWKIVQLFGGLPPGVSPPGVPGTPEGCRLM